MSCFRPGLVCISMATNALWTLIFSDSVLMRTLEWLLSVVLSMAGTFPCAKVLNIELAHTADLRQSHLSGSSSACGQCCELAATYAAS